MPDDYQRIAAAIEYLRERAPEQPPLDEIAGHLGLSPYHFQRLFKRFAGVSPKRFLQHLTSESAKQLLRESQSILETSFAVGLSSPGRLHDLLISVDAVTPGEFKSGGDLLRIDYGIHPTPFGDCLIAVTRRGVCRLEFLDSKAPEAGIVALRQAWPQARLRENRAETRTTVRTIFTPDHSRGATRLPLLLQGTNFQLKVWQALLRIPEGRVVAYGDLAEKIGCPGGGRAVGSALGNNPIGYLIPCHRVLRGDGGIGGYRWGDTRKLAILGRELAARVD